MQHFVVHCVISSWTTCHKSACNCDFECVSECECIQMTTHTPQPHTHTQLQMTNVCLCVRHCLTARAPCGDFPALARVHAFCCCCCLWFCCFLFMFFVFSLLSVRRISCGRRVICICIAIATAIAFAFMHVDPLRLPSTSTPSSLSLYHTHHLALSEA